MGWGIDDQEIMVLLYCGNSFVEFRKFEGLILVNSNPLGPPDRELVRYLESQPGTLSPGTPVLNVVGEGLLPTVEVDCGNPLARFHERDSEVHCNRGLTRAPLFVSHHDHMRRILNSDGRLQHGAVLHSGVGR